LQGDRQLTLGMTSRYYC